MSDPTRGPAASLAADLAADLQRTADLPPAGTKPPGTKPPARKPAATKPAGSTSPAAKRPAARKPARTASAASGRVAALAPAPRPVTMLPAPPARHDTPRCAVTLTPLRWSRPGLTRRGTGLSVHLGPWRLELSL